MTVTILNGDCKDILRTLPAQSVHCVVTSPPYWGLRDYGVAEQLGLEPDFNAYVANMVAVFREVRRVLRDDGTLWLNLGDSYASGEVGRHDQKEGYYLTRPAAADAKKGNGEPRQQAKLRTGLKPKDLCGIPWRVAFALQADGWYLRQDLIWSKPNPMPESVTDRCTKAHEYLFLLSKNGRYYYDGDAIREPYSEASLGRYDYKFGGSTSPGRHQPGNKDERYKLSRDGEPNALGRNKRSVWEVATNPFPEAHFATFPPALIEPCVLAGCPSSGTVLDPFGGAGTTGLVADRLGRNAILIELNPEYAAMAERRIKHDAGMFADVQMAPGFVPGASNLV
jgi:DNA modification methylase